MRTKLHYAKHAAQHEWRTVYEPWRCSLHKGRRSAARGRTVRDLTQGYGFLPDDRTVRTLGPDGPRVHRGGEGRRRRLDLAPGSDPVGEERS
jgi:hypothetical protein